MHRKLRIVHAGGKRQITVGEAAAALEQHVALAEIDAGGPDMPPGNGGFRDGDMIAVDAGVFLDDDGIGALGDDAPGENARRLARANRTAERPSRRDLADHLQPRLKISCVGRAHSIAVHRRHRLRRLRPPCRDVARQHAMKGIVERDHFLGQGDRAGKDRSKRIGDRHQGHGQTS